MTRPLLIKCQVKYSCETNKYSITQHDHVPCTQLSSLVYLLHTRFHFHMGTGSAGNLSVILQKGERGQEAALVTIQQHFNSVGPRTITTGQTRAALQGMSMSTCVDANKAPSVHMQS